MDSLTITIEIGPVHKVRLVAWQTGHPCTGKEKHLERYGNLDAFGVLFGDRFKFSITPSLEPRVQGGWVDVECNACGAVLEDVTGVAGP